MADRDDFGDLTVETEGVLSDSEFGARRKARPERVVRAFGAQLHRPKDPAKECLKNRLQEAMAILAKLADEKSNGADIRAELGRLDARTAYDLIDGSRDQLTSRVKTHEIDRMAEVLGWVNGLLSNRGDQWVLLTWAAGDKTKAMDRASQSSQWRIVNRALDKMLCGLERASTKKLDLMKRFSL
ncbi:MAG: hypothetical protein HQL42_13155 [Alphaproteobacteria bacterium]|nr:hypothetical protein [Alphaproteobacteria bacterium]